MVNPRHHEIPKQLIIITQIKRVMFYTVSQKVDHQFFLITSSNIDRF